MKIILLSCILFFGSVAVAQTLTLGFAGKIVNYDTKKAEGAVTITAMSGSKILGSGQTSSNGKYGFDVEANKGTSIQLMITKPGFVTKRIDISLVGVNDEDLPPGGVVPFSIPGEIFSERPGVDFSFTKTEAVLLIKWDEGAQQFAFEPSAKTKKKIDDLLAGGPKTEDPSEAKYQAAIKAGEALYTQKKYEEALGKYEEASSLKPKEQLPITKIAELDKLIKAQKEAAMANQQAETEYKNLIAAADNLRNQKKYTDAIAKYNEALKKKDEAYPKAEINKLNALIAEQKAEEAKEAQFTALKNEGMALATSKKWTEAKAKLNQALAIKADPAITAKIKEIDAELAKEAANKDKTDKYNAAMKLADGLFASGKLQDAKAKYTEAGTIDPTQAAPKQKIVEVDAAIAKEAALALKKAKIDKLILEGNAANAKNDLAGAKAKFEEVLKEDASNAIAIAKLREINGKLDSAKGQAEKDAQFEALKKEGMTLAAGKKYQEAKNKLTQALDIKADAALTQKIAEIDAALKADQSASQTEEDYKKLISEAGSLESAKNYDGAIAKYREALGKKPAEALPKTKIAELEKLKKSLENQGQAEAQKEALYKGHMTSGTANLGAKKYPQALSDFQNALSVKPGDAAAKAKIDEVQKIIDDLSNAQNQNAEAKKNFDKIMLDADRLFKQEKYMDAKAKYTEALQIFSDNAKAIKQIGECDRLEKLKGQSEGDAEYKKLLTAADRKLGEKDYQKAKEYYERALGIRSADPYPKKKLAEIEALLNPKPVVAKIDTPVEPLKLQPLGIPLDANDIDAQDMLKKAEIERETIKNKELKRGVDNVNDRASELENQKAEEHLATTADLVEFKQSIDEHSSGAEEKHQGVIDLTKQVVKQQDDYNTTADNLENSDRLQIQEKMNIIRAENSEEFDEKEKAFMEKGDVMKKHDKEHADDLVNQTEKYDAKSIATGDQIRDVEQTLIDKNIDDTDSHQAAAQRIENNVKEVIAINDQMTNQETSENLDNKKKIHDSQDKMGEKAEQDLINKAENNVDLEKIKHEVQEKSDQGVLKDETDGHQATEQMVALNKKLAQETTDNTDQLQNSTDVLRRANKELIDKNVIDYNAEMVKHLASQKNIKDKLNVVNEDNAESTDKLIENSGLLKDMATSLRDENDKSSDNQIQKNRQSQQAIHDKKLETVPEKVITPNSLGAEYPEGVTQEAFTNNDENGLMKSIITRRIVVIEGKGDVYVRTQTTATITYSKNGHPTTERVWQKETQGPNLVKHY